MGLEYEGDEQSHVLCRLMREGDGVRLAALFEELLEFHHQPLQDRDALLKQISAKSPAFDVIVAEVNGEVSGFALVSTYPGPGIAPGFYLKELFVTHPCRKFGVGEALMRFLARTALARGFSRVDWVTTSDNHAARSFSDRLGACPNPKKVFYRLDGEALTRLGST